MSGVVKLIHPQRRPETLSRTRANTVLSKQKLQGHFEDVGDLGTVGDRAKLSRNEADNRCDQKAGAGQNLLHTAGDGHQIGPQPDLLLGLSEGRRHRAIVRRFDTPSWKTDLPGMIRKMRRTLREDHAQAVWPFDQPQQYGGRSRRVVEEIQEVLRDRSVGLGQQPR